MKFRYRCPGKKSKKTLTVLKMKTYLCEENTWPTQIDMKVFYNKNHANIVGLRLTENVWDLKNGL